jgi:hypothetical protein
VEVTSSSLVPLIGLPPACGRGLLFPGVMGSTKRARRGADGLTGGWGRSIISVCIRSAEVVGAAVVVSYALVAQLDRASDYGSEGWGFEFLQAHGRSGLFRRGVA